MAFYEVVGVDPKQPVVQSADHLADAKEMRDKLFSTGSYKQVFIRQYVNRGERYRILHRLTLYK
jgi:hypothetical protein